MHLISPVDDDEVAPNADASRLLRLYLQVVNHVFGGDVVPVDSLLLVVALLDEVDELTVRGELEVHYLRTCNRHQVFGGVCLDVVQLQVLQLGGVAPSNQQLRGHRPPLYGTH